MQNKKTILVTGANGQLGNAMRMAAQTAIDRYIFTDVAELDITNPAAIYAMVEQERVQVIVNCAAYTNVDKAEDEKDLAELLNATAVQHLAEAMAVVGGVLIHVSTDYVFGGAHNNTPCTEEQTANPMGVYGLTKLHGEEAIQRSGCHHIIIRTAWLYSEWGKNFVKTMLALTADKPQLKVVFDQCGTPTYARDLAEAICRIIEQRSWVGNDGIYHYSNEGVTSWYDFTRFIVALAGHTTCDVIPCHSDEFPSRVVRPSYSVLDKTKFKQTFGISVPYWVDSLKKCIKILKNQSDELQA